MSRSDKSRQKEQENDGVSRRGFLKGAGLTVAAVGVAGPTALPDTPGTEKAEEVEILGPGPVHVALDVNGTTYRLAVPPSATLLDVLRDRLELTGAKRVCDRGFCGACTVLVDGRTACSCSLLAVDAAGRKIVTIEGVAKGGELSAVQNAFVECDALQCGFCTPGMIMSCTALLAAHPSPSREEIAAGISGNICRCGTYQNVFEAVDLAARRGGKGR